MPSNLASHLGCSWMLSTQGTAHPSCCLRITELCPTPSRSSVLTISCSKFWKVMGFDNLMFQVLIIPSSEQCFQSRCNSLAHALHGQVWKVKSEVLSWKWDQGAGKGNLAPLVAGVDKHAYNNHQIRLDLRTSALSQLELVSITVWKVYFVQSLHREEL